MSGLTTLIYPRQQTRYGYLTVTGPAPLATNYAKRVECRCDCGTSTVVLVRNLLTNATRSCGCRGRGPRIVKVRRRYTGASRRPEYRVWTNIKDRCLRPKATSFASYGAKGITVCDRWLGESGFANFIADMGSRPSRNHDVDRIDSTRGYSPDNCRWLLHTENLRQPRPRRHKTVCKHGHLLTPENVSLKTTASGHARRCKTCHREREARRRKAA